MENSCALCSVQKGCTDKGLFLYAETPILREIVGAQLRGMNVAFEFKHDLFSITSEPSRVIETLLRQLSEPERADIRISRHSGGALLSTSTLDSQQAILDTAWFEEALVNDRFTTFFQPIVDIRSGSVFAHECLIRLLGEQKYHGAAIIDAAISRGSVHLFDSYARRLSIRNASRQFAAGTKVFINFMPSSIYDPVFCMASTMEEMDKTIMRPEDVVFEVVESEKVRDVKHLQKICDYYRNAGFAFALDDVGTGANSLQMVCDLKPDYIKLDKSLISNIEQPMYRAAIQKLTEFADQFNVKVIAEGMESAETADTVKQIGIYLMQGYFFGKPAADISTTGRDLTKMLGKVGKAVVPETISISKNEVIY